MLEITVGGIELFDEETCCFIPTKKTTLRLEHSLVSVSKWESKWHKTFLSDTQKSTEEIYDYIRCMTITQNVDPNVYKTLTPEQHKQISDYINDPMTATHVPDTGGKKNREPVTSELMYYWMIALNIPMECQKWHLNRFLTLVQVCNLKNTPPKKISAREAAKQRKALNQQRRAKMHSKG